MDKIFKAEIFKMAATCGASKHNRGHPSIEEGIKTYGGIQTYGEHPNIWGHTPA